MSVRATSPVALAMVSTKACIKPAAPKKPCQYTQGRVRNSTHRSPFLRHPVWRAEECWCIVRAWSVVRAVCRTLVQADSPGTAELAVFSAASGRAQVPVRYDA